MGFNRALVSPDAKLPQPMRAGVGWVANAEISDNAADAALAITIPALSGGFLTQSVDLTAGRIYTMPLGADIAAAYPEMDLGDSYVFTVSNGQAGAFAITMAGNTGVTLIGDGDVAQSSSRAFALVKTGAGTFNLH